MFYQIVVLIFLGLTQVHSQIEIAAGAIIGSIITASTTFAPPPDRPPGKKGGCHWSGTAPTCVGGCDDNASYEDTKIRVGNCPRDGPFDLFPDCTIRGHYFGKDCHTGTKTLCCRGNSNDLSWQGTWESTTGDTWRCKVDVNVSAKCNGILICLNENNVRETYDIGFDIVTRGVKKADCSMLAKNGDFKGEAFPGVITWRDGQNHKWFKV